MRLPSSTRPPAASRCRHVPSAQQHYDVPAKERPSVPHLGEGEAWKSPSRGRLACPPPLFLRRCPLFFFRTKLRPIIKLSNCFSAFRSLEPTSAPASTASTTTPEPITAASSRRRSPCAESATRALFAWPPAWRGIVNLCKSRPAREHFNQRIGCCLPVRCRLLLYVLLLCCTAVVSRSVGGW